MKSLLISALVVLAMCAVSFALGGYQADVYRKLLLWITMALKTKTGSPLSCQISCKLWRSLALNFWS